MLVQAGAEKAKLFYSTGCARQKLRHFSGECVTKHEHPSLFRSAMIVQFQHLELCAHFVTLT